MKRSSSGAHGISNILAGLAVASCFGIQPEELVEKVAQLAPGKMRGQRHEWRGAPVLDDSYNSNPEAARSMLDVSETGERRSGGSPCLEKCWSLGTWPSRCIAN